MRRKIALLLCITLITSFGLYPIEMKKAYAATDHAEEVINALGIMETDKGNTDIGTDIVTRARFAQMLVNLSTTKDDVTSESNISLFSDVKKGYWAIGYIKAAITQDWMSGYLNGSFKPEQGISLQEAIYGVIRLLGYGNNDFNGNRASAIMNLYKTKSLNTNINKSRIQYLTVNDCRNLFYNTLNATTKEGMVYASVLGYTVNDDGELDYLSLVNSGISGPVIVDGNWKNELPFSAAQATMYKYGKKCSYSDIKDYDVIYYSEKFKTIWIYDDKVTGTIDSINPDYTSPQSVTVSGNDYSFTGSDVTLRFSSMGDVKVGDTVTLLLGKDGKVADVLNIDEYNTSITGVVLELGTRLTQDQSIAYKNVDYVSFVDAAGNEYTQNYDADSIYLTKGGLVRVAYANGVVTISGYVQGSTSFGNNTFNSNASALGSMTLTSNVKILDMKDGNYISISPERLAGVQLRESTLYYYELNDDGEISQLILNDVTGDMNSYGIFTGIRASAAKMNYTYLIGNKTGSLTTDKLSNLNLNIGPSGFVFENNILTESYSLTEEKVTSIGINTIQDYNMKLPLADKYYVYILLNGEYILTTIDKISDLSKFNVKAYYDKPISNGGKIRVIVAESIQQ